MNRKAMKVMKKLITIIMALSLICFGLAGCKNDTSSGIDATKPQKVLVTMENGKTFTIKTSPQNAPETSKNFLELVDSGFYNGLTFHRVIPGFMAQGGDPKGNGTGGAEKTIKGEFSQNGFKDNKLSHTRGIVSMARSQAPDSASSQFFICFDDATYLDGAYAAFGEVIDGMDVVDEFAKTACDKTEKPLTPVVIKTMEIIK